MTVAVNMLVDACMHTNARRETRMVGTISMNIAMPVCLYQPILLQCSLGSSHTHDYTNKCNALNIMMIWTNKTDNSHG